MIILKTPEEYRDHQAKWAMMAPANDCDIIPPPLDWSEEPRHAKLAAELAPLLTWRALCRASYEDTSQWLVSVANDNSEDDDAPREAEDLDSKIEMRPSPSEIMARLAGVDWSAPRLTGDVKYNADGVLIRAGGLRFAIGHEYCWTTYTGEVIWVSPGTILGYRSASDRTWNPVKDAPKTPEPSRSERARELRNLSVAFLTYLMAWKPPVSPLCNWIEYWTANDYPAASRASTSLVPNPARRLLAALGVDGSVPFDRACERARRSARKDTIPVLPTWDAERPRWSPWDGFVGLRCSQTGKEVGDAFGAAEQRIMSASELAEARRRMGEEDCKVLDVAATCRSFEQLGFAVMPEAKRAILCPKTAERQGKTKLRRATAHLRAHLKALREAV